VRVGPVANDSVQIRHARMRQLAHAREAVMDARVQLPAEQAIRVQFLQHDLATARAEGQIALRGSEDTLDVIAADGFGLGDRCGLGLGIGHRWISIISRASESVPLGSTRADFPKWRWHKMAQTGTPFQREMFLIASI